MAKIAPAEYNWSAPDFSSIWDLEGDVSLLQKGILLLTTDTRELPPTKNPGELTAFVALVGEGDGHDFVSGAVAAGVDVIVAHKGQRDRLRADLPGAAPRLWLWVDDGRAFLLELAAQARRRMDIPVVGITGTNGKSSFKEILRQLLGSSCYYSQKNYNNEIGLPFTLLQGRQAGLGSADGGQGYRYAVLEMGMNHSGEISRLSRTARPNWSVITSIGSGHLEFLGSVAAIAEAKAEILDGMAAGGRLYIHGGAPYLAKIRAKAESRGIEVVTFGLDPGYDHSPHDYELSAQGSRFVYAQRQFSLPLLGKHQLQNAVGALAVATDLGLELSTLVERLASVDNLSGRMSLTRYGDVEVLFDAYNANPDSVRAGVDSVFYVRHKGRRLVCLLGEMKELGEGSAALHKEVGEYITKVLQPGDLFFAIGEHAHDLALGPLRHLGEGSVFVFGEKERESLAQSLARRLRQGDLVYAKASRGIRLEEFLTHYAALGN